MEIITSEQNKFVKEILKSMKSSKDSYIVEGKKFVLDITNFDDVICYALSETFFDENQNIFELIDKEKVKVLKDNVFKKISDTKTSQGILAFVKKPEINVIDELEKASLSSCNIILILDNLQDPGNFGTIIRTFEATGGKLIFATKGTVSAYNTKCVRSSANAISNVSIIDNLEKEEISALVKKYGYSIVGTHLSGKIFHFDIDFNKKYAIVIGNEGNGMSDYFTNESDLLVKIPIIGKSESLNASVATSVILYEALRQTYNK